MTNETRTITDPFLNKEVEISNRLTDRLRGRYAKGPTLPNGEPEFGWSEFETPPIQHEAAAEIERLQDEIHYFKTEYQDECGIAQYRELARIYKEQLEQLQQFKVIAIPPATQEQ